MNATQIAYAQNTRIKMQIKFQQLHLINMIIETRIRICVPLVKTLIAKLARNPIVTLVLLVIFLKLVLCRTINVQTAFNAIKRNV